VSDRNRNYHFRPKPNIRQQKSTEYSVSAEYSSLLLAFGRKSMIFFIHTAKFIKFGQNLTTLWLPGFKHYYMLINNYQWPLNSLKDIWGIRQFVAGLFWLSVSAALAEYSVSAEYSAERFGRNHLRSDTKSPDNFLVNLIPGQYPCSPGMQNNHPGSDYVWVAVYQIPKFVVGTASKVNLQPYRRFPCAQ
jgi:hypothetical protein